MDGRLKRRTAGVLKAGLMKLREVRVHDPRCRQNRRWGLWQLLGAVLAGLCAGRHSLGQVERLTADLSPAVRKLLGVGRRVPDTTLRDLLVRLHPNALRSLLWGQVRRAHRQKALQPEGLPFGVVGVDGKGTALNGWGGGYAQRQIHAGSAAGASGLLRTYTAMLLSSVVPVCLDAPPIPPETNEDGYFRTLIDGLLALYGGLDLFRLVVADAGACSLANADHLRKLRLHYLFTLNEKQPTLYHEAVRILSTLTVKQSASRTSDVSNGVLEERSLFLTEEMADYLSWRHLVTVLRIERKGVDRKTRKRFVHNRYFVSSLRKDALTPDQWLALAKRYWAAVESGCHRALDVAFDEDRHPWIKDNDKGALNVLILRRIAYNLVALFRGRTQRSEERRAEPWATVLDWFYQTLIAATGKQIAGLRPRAAAAQVP